MSVVLGWQGRFFEDFEVGDIYRHPLGRTITESDNTWFSLLTQNTNQMHFNRQYAEASEFAEPLLVSTMTLAIAIGQSVTDLTQNAFANLALDEVRFITPMFAGDTLWSESLVLDKRESASRPHAGVVSVRTRSINQRGEETLSFRRAFYVYRRGAEQLQVRPEPQTPIDVDPTSGESRR